MSRKAVVLPQPDGPSRASIVPDSSSRLTSVEGGDVTEGLADLVEPDGDLDGVRGAHVSTSPRRTSRPTETKETASSSAAGMAACA